VAVAHGMVRSTVVVLGGQGSGDGEHEEKNVKGKSTALSSQRIKTSVRWPIVIALHEVVCGDHATAASPCARWPNTQLLSAS
jgi:hypothetical protein